MLSGPAPAPSSRTPAHYKQSSGPTCCRGEQHSSGRDLLGRVVGCKTACSAEGKTPVSRLALLCVCTSHPSTPRGFTRRLHAQFGRTHSANAVAIAWLLVHFWVSAHSATLTHSKSTFISRCLARTRELKRTGNVQGFQQLSLKGKESPLPAHTRFIYSLLIFHLFRVLF